MGTVTTRKDHVCDACGCTIKKGSKADYWEAKTPKFEDGDFDGKQTGIEYLKGWICFNDDECFDRTNKRIE